MMTGVARGTGVGSGVAVGVGFGVGLGVGVGVGASDDVLGEIVGVGSAFLRLLPEGPSMRSSSAAQPKIRSETITPANPFPGPRDRLGACLR